MASLYTERLIKRVIELSQSNNWDTAVTEWEIADCEEDDTLSESCICGKEHLYYLFTIENAINGNTLFPIGSSCIKKFGRSDLDDEAAVREKMFKLYHAVEANQFISLSPDFFSRKLLKSLYEEGAWRSHVQVASLEPKTLWSNAPEGFWFISHKSSFQTSFAIRKAAQALGQPA